MVSLLVTSLHVLFHCVEASWFLFSCSVLKDGEPLLTLPEAAIQVHSG